MTDKKNLISSASLFYCMKLVELYQLDFILLSLEVIFVSLRSIHITMKH